MKVVSIVEVCVFLLILFLYMYVIWHFIKVNFGSRICKVVSHGKKTLRVADSTRVSRDGERPRRHATGCRLLEMQIPNCARRLLQAPGACRARLGKSEGKGQRSLQRVGHELAIDVSHRARQK
jgi:hypothetical protein